MMQSGTHDPARDLGNPWGLEDFQIIPTKYDPARSRPDEDRNSQASMRLVKLIEDMDKAVTTFLSSGNFDPENFHNCESTHYGADMASLWAEIRKIIGKGE